MKRSKRSSIHLFFMYMRVNLMSSLEYRGSFIMQAFGMALSNSSFMFFWYMVFLRVGMDIGGYAFQDVMFIWAVMGSSFGLAHILFGNMGRISQLIITGELDTFLLQPRSVLPNVLCSRTVLSAWGDLGYGFILTALIPGANLWTWTCFLGGTLTGSLLCVGLMVSAHSLSFFWGDASIFAGMISESILNFSLYPEGIYTKGVRALMYTLIPAGFIAHVPMRLVKGAHPVWWLLMALAAALYLVIAWALFKKGLGRYESGNLIIARM